MAVQWQLADGTWENNGYACIRLGLVDPLATFDVQKPGVGLWATEYGFFVEDSLQSQKTFPGYPVTLSVFNALGQQVSVLVNGEKEAGIHDVQFDGSGLASGVYFYRMQAEDPAARLKNAFVQTRKFILAK